MKRFISALILLILIAKQVVSAESEVEWEDSAVANNNTTDINEYNIDEEFSDNNTKTTNSTDDYDYEEMEGRDGECGDKGSGLLDKWITVYNEGKDVKITKNVKDFNETINILNIMKGNLEILFKPSDNSDARYKALEFFSEIDLGLTSDCLTSLTRVAMAIGNGEIWALKFLDSMGRPLETGFAEGVQSSFGEYTECLNIVSPKADDKPDINGQYCLLKAIMPFPSTDSMNYDEPEVEKGLYSGLLEHYKLGQLSTLRAFIEALNLSNGTIYRLGICIPSLCSPQEFESLLNAILFPVTRLPLEVSTECHVKDETISLDRYQIISISILSTSTTLIILSTIYELYKQMTSLADVYNSKQDLLTSFSIIRNTKILFEKNTKFAALETFRLLLIINVHMGHAFTYTTSLGIIGLKKIFSEVMFKVYEDNEYVFVRNPLVIDAFFTLSGFLLSFCVLKKLNKTNGRFNYFQFIFERWIRFFVLMFGAILFFYIFPLTGDGPIWDTGVQWVTPGCQNTNNLLKMLFFVHNFRDDVKEQLSIANSKCNPPTWFLSSLLQFTLIGPIFIIIYHKKRLNGIIALISGIILSVFASIAPQILFNIRPYLQIWDLESLLFSISRSYTWYHFTPNNYCTGFLIGIGYGYLMNCQKLNISRKISTFSWILSAVCVIGVYFWNNSFWRLDHSAPLISVLLWHSLGKLLFSLGFGWIYFACCTGRGGILNKCLSWPGFQPIARLSFGIYILHYLVIMHRIFTNHYTYVMSDKYMFEHMIVDIIYDIILAYIFYLLIESPFINLFTHVFNKKSIENSSQSEENSNNSKLKSKSDNGITNNNNIYNLNTATELYNQNNNDQSAFSHYSHTNNACSDTSCNERYSSNL